MTELEKCMAGEYYDCHNEIFLDFKKRARELLKGYNALAYEQKGEKMSILKELFGGIGSSVSVASPFICDYGRNIYVGNRVSVNMNCTFVDCNQIVIGDDVLIASNVQFYTATHPVELSERLTPDWHPESGQYIALITGKGEKSCAITLEELGLSEMFDKQLYGSEISPNKKEHMEYLLNKYSVPKEKLCYIGDAVQDIKACQTAGVVCFSAAWQESARRDVLEKENPGRVFGSAGDLLEYLKCGW